MRNKKGFTLLELLIVVLIIGILSAIALPQYRKSVLRSKFATIKDMTHAIYQAEQRYYLEHDAYTTNWNDLDIDRSGADCKISNVNGAINPYVLCNLRNKQGNIMLQYIIMMKTGKLRCDAFPADINSTTNQVCQMETNLSTPNGGCSSNFCIYYNN